MDSLINESAAQPYRGKVKGYLLEIEMASSKERYEKTKFCMWKAAQDALGFKGQKKRNKLWWNREIDELVEEKNKCHKRWLNTGQQEDKERYLHGKREAWQIVQREKRLTRDKNCSEIFGESTKMEKKDRYTFHTDTEIDSILQEIINRRHTTICCNIITASSYTVRTCEAYCIPRKGRARAKKW